MPYKDPEKQKAFMRQYNQGRRARMQEKLTDFLGGICAICGVRTDVKTGKIIENGKPIRILNKVPYQVGILSKRIRKWTLQCTPCTEKPVKITPGHGLGKTGVRGCRCEQCGPLKRSYFNARNARVAAEKARLATLSSEGPSSA